MAVTVDWGAKIISVLRADMLLVQSSPSEIRQLDLDAFRLELIALEDDAEGISYVSTHSHNTVVSVGGVTLARVIQIINDYTITFEDGQYAVNLVGANSNVADVTNVNQVSIRSANSAGLTYSEDIIRLVDLAEADQELTSSKAYLRRRGTSDILLEKDVTGGTITDVILDE